MRAERSELSEEQLRANRYELISRLADDLAHEIKNPLNAIIINLEVLKVRIGKDDGQSALDRAEVIEHEVRRLHHLVDRMLMLVRPDREFAPTVPLDSALDELLPLIEAQTRLARNEFVSECDGSVIVPVRRDLLKFALLNLFVAVHTSLGEGGGTLAIRCTNGENGVQITVEAIHNVRPSVPPDSDMDIAVRTAATLLNGSSGRIERLPYGVSVSLPRSASL